MQNRIAVVFALLAASTNSTYAQERAQTSAGRSTAFTSAEGRSMSFELFAMNRSGTAAMVASIDGASGRSTGKRQHEPIRVRKPIPAGANASKLLVDGTVPNAAYAELEQVSFTYVKITWETAGVEQVCSGKFPASYRASDGKIVVQLGDVAALMTPEGRPVPSKCQER